MSEFLLLLQDFSFLLVILFLYTVIRRKMASYGIFDNPYFNGLVYTFVAYLSMLIPVHVAPGVQVDGRNAVIALAGYFGGPIVGIIPGILIGLYRLSIGGEGGPAGLLNALLATGISILFYYNKSRFKKELLAIITMALLMTFMTILSLLFLPIEIRLTAYSNYLIPSILIYPIGLVIYSLAILSAQKQYENENRLKVLNSQLETLVNERTKALEESNKGLKEEIKSRTETEIKLEQAIGEAEKANTAKSEFLANMSHEIRTPLNAILGYAHLLSNTSLNNQQKVFLEKMNSSSSNLLSIVNDILDFSKIEAGKIDLRAEPFNLYQLVHKIMDTVSYELVRKELTLTVRVDDRIPEWVIGDEGRISQVLLNLLTNAVKFTHEGSIALSIDEVRSNYHEDVLAFTVTDTGIGIEKDKVVDIFYAFTQANMSINRQYGGTGLGLAITKKLVELMGGTIQLTSEIHKGTTFKVVLPMEKSYQKIIRLTTAYSVVLLTPDAESVKFIKKQFQKMDVRIQVISSINQLHKDQIVDYVLVDWRQKIAQPNILLKLVEERALVRSGVGFIALERSPSYRDYIESNREGLNVNFPKGSESLASTLAFTEKDNKPISTEEVSKKDHQGKKILIVEDNPLNQDIEKHILEDEGLVVSLAAHGLEALEKVKETTYDLIFMDLHMPIMGGYDAAKEIRKIEGTMDIPIVAMTADVRKGVKDQVLESGMNDYISKPINVNEVYGVLEKWL